MTDGFDFSELNKLVVDLGRGSQRSGALASAAIRKTAQDIEGESKQFAPVDTGNLRSSISTTITGDGRSGLISAEIGPTAEYGEYVELGTSTQAPQAYMGPAFDRAIPDFEKAIGQIAGNIL